jgi:transcriptional regulator with XRE-family HTH domain
MDLGVVLRQAREKKKLSQKEVAQMIDVSQKTYANYEMGKSQPCLKALAILEDELEVNILEVLKSQGIVFNQTGNSFKDQSTGIVNGFPKALKEQYELRIKE